MQRHILIIEDHDGTWQQVQKTLQNDPSVKVESVPNGAAALQALSERHYSILIMDLLLADGEGLPFIEETRKRNLPVAIIVLANHSHIDDAVQAMRLGAYDFLKRP